MEGNFSMKDAQALLAKVMDPNDNYTQEDFMSECDEMTSGSEPTHKFPIPFVNESDNQDPNWETVGSSGFDLRASENGSIEPNEFKVVSTGLFFDLPENFEIQIRARSGLAAKKGVTVLNSPGTIDSDYTGEIKVILINHGKNTFDIAVGDRIAQAVISTVTAMNIIRLNKVSKIDKDTERGTGGFGSTGVK